jgi:hypothetical protein
VLLRTALICVRFKETKGILYLLSLEPMSTTLSETNDGQTRQVNLGLIACIFSPQVENYKLENILEDNNQNGGFGGQSGPMENILLNGEHLTPLEET